MTALSPDIGGDRSIVALLDAYADETDFERGDLNDNRENEAPKAFDALRAVLELHVPTKSGECAVCTDRYDGEFPVEQIAEWWMAEDYPCSTVRAITDALEGQ